MNTKTLFSSASGDWETPHDLFDKLWDEFGGFDLDPCCTVRHHTAHRILGNGGQIYVPDKGAWEGGRDIIDGLAQPWHGKVYMNPPYGRGIGQWVEKAIDEVYIYRRAELVVALLPARTDTKWWQGHVLISCKAVDTGVPHKNYDLIEGDADEVRFLPGRLKFSGAENAAPFPSAIVIWRRG